MSGTISVLMICVLIAANVATIHQLPAPPLPFTTREDAKQYATKICETFRDFFGDTAKGKTKGLDSADVFVSVYGEENHFFGPDSKVRFDDDDNRVIRGYNDIKTRACLIRENINFKTGTHPCSQLAGATSFEYSQYSLKWGGITHEANIRGSGRGEENFSESWTFNFDETTGIIGVMIPSGSSHFATTAFDLTFNAAISAVNVAKYIGLIQDEVAGTNADIKQISTAFYVIIIMMGSLIAMIAVIGFHAICNKKENKKLYKFVSKPEDEEEEIKLKN